MVLSETTACVDGGYIIILYKLNICIEYTIMDGLDREHEATPNTHSLRGKFKLYAISLQMVRGD